MSQPVRYSVLLGNREVFTSQDFHTCAVWIARNGDDSHKIFPVYEGAR